MLPKVQYLLSILEKKDRRTFAVFLFLSILSPVLDVFSFSMLLFILDRTLSGAHPGPFWILLTACLAAGCAVKALLDLYKSRISNRFLYSGAQSLSFRFFDLFLHEELLEHYKKSPMQAVEIIWRDTLNSIQIILDFLSVSIQICTLTAYAAVLIARTGWLGAASIALLLLWMFVRYRTMRSRIAHFGELRRGYLIQANANITTSFGAYKELHTSRRSIHLQNRFEDTSRRYAKAESDFNYLQNLALVLMRDSILMAVYLLLLFVLLSGIALGRIVPYLIVYVTLMMKLEPISYGIVSGLNRIQFSNKSFEVVREQYGRYLDYRQKLQEKAQKRSITPTFRHGLTVEGLSFGYPGKKDLFSDVSLSVPAGKMVALIGASGSGKTTFLDLLLGLLSPQAGSIRFDDYDIVSGTDSEGECTVFLGEIVSYIPQTVFLNGETVRNNVAFMEAYDQVDEARVIDCLKAARIWDDVREMPQGIDTLIGEQGVAVSGGQRQRIALARALYKDFELLILDEATAGLDAETEKAVMDSILRMKGDKTILLVTHHAALADRCDLVYKIQNRKIVRVR